MFTAPKGVPDYVPPDSAAFLAIREALAAPARAAGYGYIELPVFEELGLFVRGVGESTDVVSKEMYTFADRGGRELALRPEGTAGVMRAVIEHGLHRGPLPVKLWYAGPFFRAERPQAGRYRQLQQVGAEAIGSEDPALDAEVVALADEAFRRVGLDDYTLYLTSLGCARCRPAYREALQGFLAGLDLDEATRQRAAINPLRVLDDKRQAVQRQLVAAPLMRDFWCADCVAHYDAVRGFLRGLEVAWEEAPRLVRGLDYYTRTTFEFSHRGLGAQSGIGGGGRYDGLMSSLGGAELSGIGWGIGTDRTLLASRAEGLAPGPGNRCDVYLVPLGEPARDFTSRLGRQLRDAGIRSDMAFGGRGVKGAMKAADRSGARWAIIVGEAELTADTVVVKDLATGHQTTVPTPDLIDRLRAIINQEEQST